MNPGHTGFENSIRIIYGLACDGLTNKNTIPKSLKRMALVVCMSDMNLPGFFTYAFPLLKFSAKRAKANGEEKMLIDKYCI